DNQHTTDEVRIKLLVMVAIADGHWDRREVALVERMAARSGMSVAEVEALRDDPTFTMKELSQAIPQDNAGRIAFFADLVRVACADRDVHERELALLVRVGTALGFQADEVETIVEDAC
ncbi:MAG: TerB family tellurite resistance protein, partial [Phycisphaerae bacterium]